MVKRFKQIVKDATFEYFYPLWLFWQMERIDKFRVVAMLIVGIVAAAILWLPNINLITIIVIAVIDLFIVYDLLKIFFEQHYIKNHTK